MATLRWTLSAASGRRQLFFGGWTRSGPRRPSHWRSSFAYSLQSWSRQPSTPVRPGKRREALTTGSTSSSRGAYAEFWRSVFMITSPMKRYFEGVACANFITSSPVEDSDWPATSSAWRTTGSPRRPCDGYPLAPNNHEDAPGIPGEERSYKIWRRLTWHGMMPKLSPKTEADGEWLLPDILHSMGGTKKKK